MSPEHVAACRSCLWMRLYATRGHSRQRALALAGLCPGAAGPWACGAGAVAVAGACAGDCMQLTCCMSGAEAMAAAGHTPMIACR